VAVEAVSSSIRCRIGVERTLVKDPGVAADLDLAFVAPIRDAH